MRLIVLVLFFVCMGTFAQAQGSVKATKVEIAFTPISKAPLQTKLKTIKLPILTGIYIMKNSRVKRALAFSTKKRSCKLA